MKSRQQVFLLFVILFLITACSRKWTEKDRQDFIQSCITTSLKHQNAETAERYCHCMLQKIEKKYPDVNDVKYISRDTSLNTMVEECKKSR